MVSTDDCPCTDATEASNLTSLQMDASCISDSNNVEEAHSGFINEEDNTFQEYSYKDCKCREIHSTVNHGVLQEQYERTDKVGQSPKKEIRKEQSSVKQNQSAAACLCYAHKINAYTLPLKYRNDVSYSRPFWCRFKWKWPKKGHLERKDKTYQVKLKEKKCPHYEKPFMCCEISEGIPNKKKQCIVKPNKLSNKLQPPPKKEVKQRDTEKEAMERIDIYYFDHGNSAYYRTTDSPPILATEKCAEKTDQAATRFWAEIFGTIHIGTAFVTAFILQFVRFILYSVIRPLTVGVLQLLADYFVKPFLSIIFNAFIQPVLILFYNIATSFKDLCEPIAEAMGLFLREVANLCAAIRIVEVKQGSAPSVACT